MAHYDDCDDCIESGCPNNSITGEYGLCLNHALEDRKHLLARCIRLEKALKEIAKSPESRAREALEG